MMLGKAGLDAFLQSWNEVRQSIKKDDPIPVILFIFSLFFANVQMGLTAPGLSLR